MKLEEAITTALEYEGRVHRTYSDAVDASEDDVARRVFSTLRDEEAGHIKYLRDRLDEWRSEGTITVAELDTVLVSKAEIEAGAAVLRDRLSSGRRQIRGSEFESLKKALDVEVETSAYYKKMVASLDGDGRRLFERFVEIEEGHVAIVQAELDMVSGTGFWFDTAEFSLEKA
jgi:rubrerythrin